MNAGLVALFGAMAGTAMAEQATVPLEVNSALGSYLAARVAEDMRDTEAANALLKLALSRDPGNPVLLQQSFINEMMAGNWDQAVGFAQRLIASEPNDPLARLVLGVSAFKAGRLGEADKHFAEPGATPIAVMARAWVMSAHNDVKGALALLDTLKDQTGAKYMRGFNRAVIADLAGDGLTASKEFADLFAAQPGAVNFALAYAGHASQSGDQKLAQDILHKHVESISTPHPLILAAQAKLASGDKLPLLIQSASDGLAQVFYAGSQSLTGQGGLDLGLIYAQLSLQLKPGDMLELVQLAGVYEQLKQYDSAIATYKRIPPGSPLSFEIGLREALNLNALDRADEAKSTLLDLADPAKIAAANADSAHAAVHAQVESIAGGAARGDKLKTLKSLLAKAGYDTGSTDATLDKGTRDAVTRFEKDAGLPVSMQMGPATRKALEDRIVAKTAAPAVAPQTERLIDLYLTLGDMLRGRKDFSSAVEYYTKAIGLIGPPSKRDWEAFYSRAVCYERENIWDKAETDFLKAVELSPEEPLVLNYLGYSWVDRNEHLDKALELIKKAVALKPDDGYYVDSLGWAYYKMARYDEAVDQLEHAVELKADDPVINEHLGDAYWRAGRRLEAQYQWSTSLTLKPDTENIPKLQDKLKNGLPPEKGVGATAKEAGAEIKDKSKQQ
jgi:tetratricopeptide (TPR) repeat protein